MIVYEYIIDGKMFSTSLVENIPAGVSYTTKEVEINAENIKEQQMYATMLRYEKHKADGWDYYQRFRAGLVWEIRNNNLTVEQAFLIENYLSIGYDKIAQNGDWMTASYKLKQIVLPSQYQFVKPYLDKAIEILDTYILNNYPQT